MIFGKGKLIENKIEKLNALEAITNHILLGRWDDARKPNEKELNATSVVSLKIDEASAKIDPDHQRMMKKIMICRFGQVLYHFQKNSNSPKGDPKLKSGILLPDYIDKLIKSKL